jgi:broad specificity phosphatase PhoE
MFFFLGFEQVYVSPLLRCAQTGGAAASVLGVSELVVCTALAEAMNEDWYRSWGVPGADSTWGGPTSSPKGQPVAREDLHPMALGPSQACLSDAKALQQLADAHAPAPAALRYTLAEPPAALAACASPAVAFSWDKGETHEEQVARMAALCEGLRDQQKADPDAHCSVLLVSHGGPTTGLFKVLTGIARAPNTGYTGLFCYAWSEGNGIGSGSWEALVVADHEHLNEVAGATQSGPSDMVEQAL